MQISQNNDLNIRFDADGLTLTVLTAGHSFTAEVAAGADSYMHWSWGFTMPHEDNFMLYVGIFGLALMLASLLLAAYFIKTYPIFSLGRGEILVEKLGFIMCLAGAVIGFGLTVTWLMA